MIISTGPTPPPPLVYCSRDTFANLFPQFRWLNLLDRGCCFVLCCFVFFRFVLFCLVLRAHFISLVVGSSLRACACVCVCLPRCTLPEVVGVGDDGEDSADTQQQSQFITPTLPEVCPCEPVPTPPPHRQTLAITTNPYTHTRKQLFRLINSIDLNKLNNLGLIFFGTHTHISGHYR